MAMNFITHYEYVCRTAGIKAYTGFDKSTEGQRMGTIVYRCTVNYVKLKYDLKSDQMITGDHILSLESEELLKYSSGFGKACADVFEVVKTMLRKEGYITALDQDWDYKRVKSIFHDLIDLYKNPKSDKDQAQVENMAYLFSSIYRYIIKGYNRFTFNDIINLSEEEFNELLLKFNENIIGLHNRCREEILKEYK